MNRLSEIGHVESFKIRTSEIDLNRRIRIPSLIQLMQEASMSNAIQLGVSVWDLEENSKSWVLVKKEIEILELPSLGETIHITTYPSGLERLFAYRDFIVKNDHGKVLAVASSVWILMDIQSRKVVKPEFDIPVPTDVEVLARPTFNLKKPSSKSISKDYRIEWFDLDWNNHVNNVYLLKCFLETTPEDILRSRSIKTMKIQFKSEGLIGDQLICYYEELDHTTSNYSIIRQTDDKIIALAKIEWK